MVAADTGSKRKELEQNVMKTFYLKNAASPPTCSRQPER